MSLFLSDIAFYNTNFVTLIAFALCDLCLFCDGNVFQSPPEMSDTMIFAQFATTGDHWSVRIRFDL